MQKWLLLGCFAFLLSFSLPSLAEEETSADNGKEPIKTYHLANGVDLFSNVKIQYGKPRVVVKAVFPELLCDIPNESVDEFNALVSEFLEKTIADFSALAASNQIRDKDIPKTALKNDLYIDFAASYLQSGNPIVSIRFSIQGNIIGMAHPYHQHYTLNYDLKEGEELSLSDLFETDEDFLKIFSDYSRQILTNRHLTSNEFILKGTEPTLENFKHWNLKPNGILITFDEYQVAPYVDGAQTVLIPYSLLTDVISEDSAILGCITHKTRCQNSNLLTGGFIDEAALKIKPLKPPHGALDPIFSKR